MKNHPSRPNAQNQPLPNSVKVTQVQSLIHQSSRPIPAPAEFEHYERVLPGAADRILTMAEKEQSARISLKEQQHRSAVKTYGRGQYLGAFLGTLGLTYGAGLLYLGKSIEGFAVLAGSLGALASKTVWEVYNIRKKKDKDTEG